jgi:hypothetical protein
MIRLLCAAVCLCSVAACSTTSLRENGVANEVAQSATQDVTCACKKRNPDAACGCDKCKASSKKQCDCGTNHKSHCEKHQCSQH